MEYLHQLSQSDLEVAQTTFPVGVDVRALRLDPEFHHQNGGRRDHAQQPLDPLLVAYPALRKTETPALLVEKLLFDAEMFRVAAEDVREIASEGDDVPGFLGCVPDGIMAATSSRSPWYAEKGTKALLLFRTDQTSGTALSRKIRETRTMQKALK